MSLKEYLKKRDFSRTKEPAGRKSRKKKRARSAPIFVVHRHEASRLHFDFRLQVRSALKSWAVPKGPSLDPRHRRLAVMVEDHPLEYAAFEGVIPEREYGGGTVIIWDRGTYENVTRKDGRKVRIDQALRDGHLDVRLRGEKLHGEFALIRTAWRHDKDNWILVKVKDADAAAGKDPATADRRSVVSGRTNEELAEG